MWTRPIAEIVRLPDSRGTLNFGRISEAMMAGPEALNFKLDLHKKDVDILCISIESSDGSIRETLKAGKIVKGGIKRNILSWQYGLILFVFDKDTD